MAPITDASRRTYFDEKARAWKQPKLYVRLAERRMRRRRDSLDAAGLTRWHARRHVLRERGVSLPPIQRSLP